MNRLPVLLSRAVAASLLAACASVAGADEVVWRNVLYADVTDVAADKGQVTFRLPNGASVSKPIDQVQEIRLTGQDAFNQAEEVLRAGGVTRAIGLYEAALKAPHPPAHEALIRARADWARQRLQAAALALEARRKQFQAGGRLSLDEFAAAAISRAASRPAASGAADDAEASAPCVLWRLTLTAIEVNGNLATLKAVSPRGSTASTRR